MLELIALVGSAGSGKDTIASYFVRDGYVNVKFSEPVKKLTREYLGRELNMAKDRQLVIDVSFALKGELGLLDLADKYGYPLVDKILDYSRDQKEKCWSEDFWAKKVIKDLNFYQKYVFTDIRLLADYNVAKSVGTKFVLLDTPLEICYNNLVNRDGAADKEIYNARFETEFRQFEFDLVVKTVKHDKGERTYLKAPNEIYEEIKRGLWLKYGNQENI